MMRYLNHGRPPRGRLLVAFLTATLTLLWAATAHSHGSDSDGDKGSIRAVLDPIPPALSQLRVQLRKTLAPQLLVANPTDKSLTIHDEAGRPFLRIGPEHTEGDLGAAAFHRTNTLMAPGAIPAEASEDPRWAVVEATPNWGWFDLRLRTEVVDLPHKVIDAGERSPVGQWSIPVRLGDTESLISGHFEYVPAPAGIAQAKVVDIGALKGQALIRAMPGSDRPGLFLSYRGDSSLVLMGEQDEPFLRFSSQGVEANRHSPTWANVAPAGAPSFLDNQAGAEARWAKVSDGQSYGWIEPRAAYADRVENPKRPGVVKRWQIPIRIGDSSSRIEGLTEWLPVESIAGK
ncbi:hypothetical protein [Marinobacter sp. ATCH36]|uniref:hypothetical protein n=1 Tax=Marinobacter sp. ATCH36 TaxID=2945106 RepID=UPI0020211C94|nr:hypothetical protein [Marinobacter sp. ATCH36]MCL7945557.1 hypothetical protein [Marinobacter sp. ATCH36]